MISIESVRFKNFLSFGSRWQEIQFPTGVNVVLGLDVDKDKSNGAGKSSFLETITFALFGQIHKPVKKDDIINWKNRRACLVELNFRKGEITYTVRRGIKPNVFEIFENGILIDKPAHVRDYQAILEDIIGLNFQTFMSLIHSNINSSQPVLAMKKPEKRKFMDKIFGLELYSWLNDKANEKLRSVNDKIRESEIRISANRNRAGEIASKIASLEAKIRQTSSTASQLKEHEDELEILLEKFNELEDDPRGDITAKESKLSYLKNISEKIENKNINHVKFKLLAPVEFVIKGLEDEMKRYEELRIDREKIKEFYGKYGTLDKLKKLFSKKNDELNKVGSELKEVHDLKNEILSYIRENGNNLARNTDTLNSLKSSSICPTCGQKIKDVPHDHIEALEKENEILIESISESKKKRDELLHKEQELRQEIDDMSIEVRNLDDDWRNIESIENRLAHEPEVNPDVLVHYHMKRDKYNVVIELLRDQLQKFDREIIQLNTDVNLLTERKNHLDREHKKITDLEEKINILKQKVDLEEENKAVFQDMLASEKKLSKSIVIENEKHKKDIEQKRGIIDYLDSIKWVCKDENIKRFAISYMMPYLNSRVNHYLSEVGYGFYTTIDNWLEATIKGPGVPNGSYGSLSGGEARGIDLALQFAIHDVARLRSGIWPDLIVMDEILDSSIDGKGIEKLMEIISIRQQEEASKIFIISHREEIGESFDADNIFYVTKKDGFSKVEMK